MLGRNLDDAGEWVRSWNSQPSGRAEATATLADRVAGLSASATGRDGAVRVSVDSSGNVTALELVDTDLAAEVLRAMRRAQAGLAEQVAAAVRETVGPDSETGKAVLESFTQRFPEPEDKPSAPVMPSPPPLRTFESKPTLPHQSPGNGFESGRDSRAR